MCEAYSPQPAGRPLLAGGGETSFSLFLAGGWDFGRTRVRESRAPGAVGFTRFLFHRGGTRTGGADCVFSRGSRRPPLRPPRPTGVPPALAARREGGGRGGVNKGGEKWPLPVKRGGQAVNFKCASFRTCNHWPLSGRLLRGMVRAKDIRMNQIGLAVSNTPGALGSFFQCCAACEHGGGERGFLSKGLIPGGGAFDWRRWIVGPRILIPSCSGTH